MFFLQNKTGHCKAMQSSARHFPVNVIIVHQMQERYLGPVTGHASKV